ncbi:MAG: hypothetical protein WCA07_14825 [Gloeobacterales cyanobacterium]
MSDVRERLMNVAAQRNYRVTIGEVAAESGVPLADARRELTLLARDTQGHLQVSEQGEVIYEFSPQWKQILEQKQLKEQLLSFWNSIKGTLFYVVRISFGIVLVISILIIVVALIALYIAANSNRNDNDRRDDGFSFGGGGFGYFWNPYIFYWGDPYDYREKRRRRGEKMGFLEGVFSFIFGEGDPNRDLEERRWRLIGRKIRQEQGVVTAEQLAPYLEGPYNEQEDYVLPALVKFDGQPQVSDTGELVYVFPQLQVSANESYESGTTESLVEKPWKFSEADGTTLLWAGLLGVANFLGAWFLAFQLDQIPAELGGYLGWVEAIMPFLLAYGTLFLAIPAYRYFTLGSKNIALEKRNAFRANRVKVLKSPDAKLQKKIAWAKQFTRKQVIGKEDVIYSTDRDMLDQKDLDMDDFDRKLKS